VRESGGALTLLPLNFSQRENFHLAQKFSSKNTKLGSGNPVFWENLGAKLKFQAPAISSVEN